jgi:hypothetical protein
MNKSVSVGFFMEREGFRPTDYINKNKVYVHDHKKGKGKLEKTIQPGSHDFLVTLFGSENNQKKLSFKGVLVIGI